MTRVCTIVGKRESRDLNLGIWALEPCTPGSLTSHLSCGFGQVKPTFRNLFPDL